MAKINLLPWRDSLRQSQKRQYIASLGLIAVVVFGLFWLAGTMIDQKIRNQDARNDFLKQEISVLDAQIDEIRRIKEAKGEIVLRMSLIEQLQVSRSATPIIFEELANLIPAGVAFSSVKREGDDIILVGTSESNNRLSAFVRGLETSEIFTNPVLSSIVADATAANAISNFELSMSLTEKFAPKNTTEITPRGGR